jgi:small subunit ribosomal protein S5
MFRRSLFILPRLVRAQSSGGKGPSAAGGGAAGAAGAGGAPGKPAAASGGGKKKGKAATASPRPLGGNGPRYGHGAIDRPRREATHASVRAARGAELGGAAGAAARASPASGDPVLAALLASESSAVAGGAAAAAALGPALRGLEEPHDVRTAAATARFGGVPDFGAAFRGRVAAVPDTEDWHLLTDVEAEDGEGEAAAERAEARARAARRRAPLPGAPSAAAAAAAEARERVDGLARGLLADDAGLARAQAATAGAWGIPGARGGLFFGPDGRLVSPETAVGLGDARLGAATARALRGLPAAPSAAARAADAAAFDAEHGTRLLGPSGDDARDAPRGVLEEWSMPLGFADARAARARGAAPSLLEALMTDEERELNARRRALRSLVEAPLAVATRPLWPLYALVAGADQVRLVTSGGVIDSVRCMVVVGNGRGGVGLGLATHRDAEAATKRALALAQRDMVHVATRGGALHHDLIGKKNNVYVLLRAVPATGAQANAAPALLDVLELAGVTKVSAKIFGSHRRSPYVVMQALFDAFNHNKPPEADAERRGVRLVRHTADRDAPRTVYPFSPKGPRFPAVGSKFVKGVPARP